MKESYKYKLIIERYYATPKLIICEMIMLTINIAFLMDLQVRSMGIKATGNVLFYSLEIWDQIVLVRGPPLKLSSVL